MKSWGWARPCTGGSRASSLPLGQAEAEPEWKGRFTARACRSWLDPCPVRSTLALRPEGIDCRLRITYKGAGAGRVRIDYEAGSATSRAHRRIDASLLHRDFSGRADLEIGARANS